MKKLILLALLTAPTPALAQFNNYWSGLVLGYCSGANPMCQVGKMAHDQNNNVYNPGDYDPRDKAEADRRDRERAKEQQNRQ